MPVPGFVCSSDPNATSGQFPAPISYRACTGDAPAGENGAFRTGRVISLQEIEDRDGLSFTAAFSERLVGDNLANHPAACNYTIPPGPLAGDRHARRRPTLSRMARRCGLVVGSSDYRSTLYNHALPPGSQSSCIEQHWRQCVHGRLERPRPGRQSLASGRPRDRRAPVDRPKIWKEFAQIGTLEADSSGQ